jgi:acyl carrier protein
VRVYAVRNGREARRRQRPSDDFDADSLALVDLTLAIEEAFDIEIPDEDAYRIQTVRDAINAVEKRARAGRPT